MELYFYIILACTALNIVSWAAVIIATLAIRRNLKIIREHNEQVAARAAEIRQQIRDGIDARDEGRFR